MPSDERLSLNAMLGVCAFMMIFFYFCHVYDLATGIFFAFGLGLMARGKLSEFFAIFAFAAVNRETSFLMTLVFAVWMLESRTWKVWVLSVGYQVFIFAVVRICLMVIFAGNAGVTMNIRPLENLAIFLRSPVTALIHWSLFALVIWLCIRRWNQQPRFLRVAFILLVPSLLLIYVFVGFAYEVRVFAEAFPVVWMMCQVSGFRYKVRGVK